MSTGNWFMTHRKQVAVHSLIIVAFVLFTALAAEPLFDRPERIPGEAQLQRIELPAETGGIRYNIEAISVTGRSVVEIEGWAFIDDNDSSDDEVFVVLQSDHRTYVFDAMVRERPDVAGHFEGLGLDLHFSGFMAIIPARNVRAGEYVIGIYIRKGDIEAFTYTEHRVEL